MGKCLFSPELKSYLITQWNCTTIGSCRCRKTNQWVGSGAARTYGDDTRQYSRRNGRGIWLYKRSFRHRILRFTSTEATTESCSYLARQSTQYSFRISGNRGYDSNRVTALRWLSIWAISSTTIDVFGLQRLVLAHIILSLSMKPVNRIHRF